ncbi:hypothetical protein F4802DRAFT_419432 [Xylaria palmicola]|nr:hypothetical protein F4802DRAFT_419432 [Xylaria palmicola]
MVKVDLLLSAVVVAQGVVATTDELSMITSLLKRQEPGTPAYSCHEACGQAILTARASDDVCSDEGFLTDYQSCLECAGPDNFDIWKYYGNTLSGFGEGCGLSTTPESGDTEPTTSVQSSSIATSSSAATHASTSVPAEVTVTSTSLASVSSSATQSTAAPSQSTSTSTYVTSTPAANGTVTPTGTVVVSAADASSGKAYGLLSLVMLGASYAVVC